MTRFLTYLIPLLLGAGHLQAQPPAPVTAPAASEDIRGPKPRVEIPEVKKTPVALWYGIGGGVLLAALAALLWKRRQRKLRQRDPRQIALSSLTALEAQREALPAEAFADRAAQTVRQYISARFGIAAPHRTTEEFFQDLARDAKSDLTRESDPLQAFLKSCDLAKFAGSPLDTAQRGDLVAAARTFIHSTSQAAKA
jgi:Domain of unknown function (DUF4381)